MTGKTRAKLRGLAQGENALFQVGKGGISDELCEGISQALDKRELVKITALKTAPQPPKEILQILCERLGAEPIAVTGNKMVLYRVSTADGARHIQV